MTRLGTWEFQKQGTTALRRTHCRYGGRVSITTSKHIRVSVRSVFRADLLPPKSGELQSIVPPKKAFSFWGMDHKTVGVETSSGNKYLLNFVDYTTRFGRSYAVPSKETKHVVRCVKDLISWTGPMVKILSDNALEFKGAELTSLYEGFCIKPKKTAPYSPNTNGLCEKFNETIFNIIVKTTNGGVVDWDEDLGYYVFQYNSTYHSSLGMSPYKMAFGFEPRTALELTLMEETGKSAEMLSFDERAEQLRKIVDTRRKGLDNISKAQQKQKESFKRSGRTVNFNDTQSIKGRTIK